MLYKYLFLLVLLSFSFTSCHIVQRRRGEVKFINTKDIKRGDSVLMLPSYFTWYNYLYGAPRKRFVPGVEDLAFETYWDNVQANAMAEYFRINRIVVQEPDSLYKERKLSLLLKTGYPTPVSNLMSYNYTQFMHGINNNQKEVAFSFLPDTVLKLSDSLPVLIVTNNFWFFGGHFVAGYAEGSTGLIFSPGVHGAIIKNREVVYYRNYRKKYSYNRFMKKGFTEKVTRKLFDKLDKSEVPKGTGAGK